jgi:phosphoribosylanthranilate isomerase
MSNIKSQMSNVVIKICGVTRPEDALMCAEAGADLLGLNFHSKSPRYVKPDMACLIVHALRQELGSSCPLLIGVFVNADAGKMARLIDTVGLDAAQLSGDETQDTLVALGDRVIKAIRPRDAAEAVKMATAFRRQQSESNRLPSLVVDAYHPALYGGTGQQTSVDIALAAKKRVSRLMLAGGLTPENVADQVRLIRPWGVDVASGVEKQPGIKDREQVHAFIAAARQNLPEV